MIGRRGFITGLVSLVAAPAIVRVASIMPIKVMNPEVPLIWGPTGDVMTVEHLNRMLEFANLNRPRILTISPAFRQMFDEALAKSHRM